MDGLMYSPVQAHATYKYRVAAARTTVDISR